MGGGGGGGGRGTTNSITSSTTSSITLGDSILGGVLDFWGVGGYGSITVSSNLVILEISSFGGSS